MRETKFKFYIYILPILTLAFPILLYGALFLEGGFSPNLPIFMVIFISSLMVFSFILLLFGELRTKAIYVRIENDRIIVKPYLGLGSKKEYKVDFFDGYTVSDLFSYGGTHEYLYLIKNNKKIIKLSEFHHSNYLEIKELIDTKFNFTGSTKFKMLDELIEIFKYNDLPTIPMRNAGFLLNEKVSTINEVRQYFNLVFLVNKIKTKYNDLAQYIFESLSLSTALLAIY